MKPTIGRIVHYYQGGRVALEEGQRPCAAIITFVHSDTLVNLTVFTHNGQSLARPSVLLMETGQDMPSEPCCIWPPRLGWDIDKDASGQLVASRPTQPKGPTDES